MSRKNDIEALFKRDENLLIEIELKYEKALVKKEISYDLQIDIKDFLGNLRSILDYLACDLVEKFCQFTNAKDRIYFPIRNDKTTFDFVIKKSFPGLSKHCREAYKILESIQPYFSPKNIWLKYLNEINNEQKHDRLVPQIITEKRGKVTVITKKKGVVSWDSSKTFFGKMSLS